MSRPPFGKCAYPRFRTRRHACQESSLVRQVLDTEALESADAEIAAHCARTTSASLVLAHHLGVDTGQTERSDIRDDDERAGKDDLVAGFCAFDDFGAEDHVQTVQ